MAETKPPQEHKETNGTADSDHGARAMGSGNVLARLLESDEGLAELAGAGSSSYDASGERADGALASCTRIEGLCVECDERPATRLCVTCCDDYCDPCFVSLHRKGS